MPKRLHERKICHEVSLPSENPLLAPELLDQDFLDKENVNTNGHGILCDAVDTLFPQFNQAIFKDTRGVFDEKESSDSLSERSSESMNPVEDITASSVVSRLIGRESALQVLLSMFHHTGHESLENSPTGVVFENPDEESQITSLGATGSSDSCGRLSSTDESCFIASVQCGQPMTTRSSYYTRMSSRPASNAARLIRRASCSMCSLESCNVKDYSTDGAKRQCMELSEEALIISCLNRVPKVKLCDVVVSNNICRDVSVVLERLNDDVIALVGRNSPKKPSNPCICYELDSICSDTESESDSEWDYSQMFMMSDDGTDIPVSASRASSSAVKGKRLSYLFDSIDLNAQDVVDDCIVIVDFDSSWRHIQTTEAQVCDRMC